VTATGARSFERQYFETAYFDYERQNPARKLRFYRRLLDEHLEPVEHPAILEIGCGLGSFLASLDARWIKYGFDVSVYAVSQAKAKNPDAQLVVASGLQIPFTRRFDAIVSFDVLEHLPDPEAAFDEVASHLAPAGVFAFVVPVYDGLSGPVIRRLDNDVTHLQKHGRGFWLQLVSRRFRVLAWHGLIRYLLPGGIYLNWPTTIGRRHTPAIAVVAQLSGAAR
jgi:SAM-dependent methyltransferase